MSALTKMTINEILYHNGNFLRTLMDAMITFTFQKKQKNSVFKSKNEFGILTKFCVSFILFCPHTIILTNNCVNIYYKLNFKCVKMGLIILHKYCKFNGLFFIFGNILNMFKYCYQHI